MRAQSFVLFATSLSICISLGCSSAPPPDPCASIVVDDFKELMVIEPSVLSDARALNASSGVWSFRHVVESLVPANADASKFVQDWFNEWVTTQNFNGYPLDAPNETRVTSMNQEIMCPWMQRTAGNNCNVDCSQCAANPPKIDLAQAPFRPIAIVNRMDLRDQPDLGASGESRIIFALYNGAADDAASTPMPMTMIFEYGLPTTKTAQQWANEWHALGSHAAFDDAFKTALAAFTEEWIGRGSSSTSQNSSALSQVRTNESALDWIWQERQFELGKDGGLHLAGLRNTPPDELNGSQVITNYILANSSSVITQSYAMPQGLLGGSTSAQLFQWSFPGVSEEQRRAFSTNTCNGCHTQEKQNLDTAFHVSPFRTGIDRLSQFVYDPLDRSKDQLTVREQAMRAALCGK